MGPIRVALIAATLLRGLAAQQENTLPCHFDLSRPVLDYSLRYRISYSVQIPLKKFTGEGHRLRLELRATSENQEPITVATEGELPDIPPSKDYAEPLGEFFAGEGLYTVDAQLEDEQGRTCAHQWRMEVKRNNAERDLATPPEARIGKLTVILHAVPPMPHQSNLRDAEVRRLVDSLDSIARVLGPESIRLVICNLDWQQTIRTINNFTRAQLPEIETTLRKLDFGAVDYRTLQGTGNASGMLTKLLARESTADAVIVFGHVPFLVDAGDWNAVLGLNRLWYLQLQPGVPSSLTRHPKQRGAPLSEDEVQLGGTYRILALDHIAEWIARLHGETIAIGNASDLADALYHIRKTVEH